MAFRIGPISSFGATEGKTFPTVITVPLSEFVMEGFGVSGVLAADVELHYVFRMPPVLPTGTAKLELTSWAWNGIGAAKVNPKWKSFETLETLRTNTSNFNAEGTTTIDWYNESQLVTITGATGGTFTLTFAGQTTSALAYDATAAQVESALCALSNIGASGCDVTGANGGPYTVEFTAADLQALNVVMMTANADNLTGTDPSIDITVAQEATGYVFQSPKVVLDADTIVADEFVLLRLVMESTGWTLNTNSVWLPTIVWE